MLDYFRDGRKYSGGTHRLVYTNAKGARGGDNDDDDDDNDDDDDDNEDAASPAAKRRSSLSPAKAAMLSPNKWKQTVLSHRSILYLQLMKSACGISDNKFLLFQYLLHSLVVGEAPGAQEFKGLCIGGKSHTQRVRQLTWRIMQNKVELVNASEVKFFSIDMTGLGGTEMNSQHVYFFNSALDAPDSLPLPSPPVGAKDAAHAAGALMDSCQTAKVSTVGTQGGCSDNAPNAANAIAGFFKLTEEDANGVDNNGETIGTIVNGVVKRLLFVGSPIHQLHLFFQHWRAASVSGKTDMHDPNHLQMVYKFGAILRSDQRVSKSGSCNSLYQAIMNEVYGGHPQAKGWWSAIVTQEHEGRWGVFQKALAFAWLDVFKRSSLFILECLGSGDGRAGEGDMAGDEAGGDTSGSAAAMFILGPLLMDAERRQLIGVPATSGLGPGLPRAAPKGAFVSQLSDFAQQEEGVTATALAGGPSPRA